MTDLPHILVLDSGLGGLSVLAPIRESLPNAALIYIADTDAFPYGNRNASDILARATRIIIAAQNHAHIALVVLACNTLSTLCLDELRAAINIPFVGTVPAIKLAAHESRTKRFTLLATPNTASSSYTNALINTHARDCVVDVVAAPLLASLAESYLIGDAVNLEHIRAQIAPCFFNDARGKTDAIVLGCTHYPFLIPLMHELSPWPVAMIDPAFAIAKQTARLWNTSGAHSTSSRAFITRKSDIATYSNMFERFGFSTLEFLGV